MDFSNLFKLIFKPSEVDFIEANAVLKAIEEDSQANTLMNGIKPPEVSLEEFLNEYGERAHSNINEVEVSDFSQEFAHVAIVHYVLLSGSKTIDNTIADYLGDESPIHAGVIGSCIDAALVLTAVDSKPHEAIYCECEKAGLEAAKLAEIIEAKHRHTLKALPQWETVIDSLKELISTTNPID